MEGYKNGTELLKDYNEKNNSNKRFADFWENKSVSKLGYKIQLENNKPYKIVSRGYHGGTYLLPEMYDCFEKWLNGEPALRLCRDENLCFQEIKKAFKGIITFESQKNFSGYFVDFYCDEIKLCIEYDEDFHKYRASEDFLRQTEIENNHEVNFIRHSEQDGVGVLINKIIKYKMAYNVVQCIKKNTIPKKGYL